MQITRKDIDSLTITLDLTLENQDYAPKFEAELKKYKNKAQLKGFRKGMTPISVIKKMYGKAILSDVINETLQDKLFGYLDEQKINYLGQPMPNRDENLVFDLDVNQAKDYNFSFDLGLAPEVVVKGASESDEYNYYDVTIDEKTIDDEITANRRRYGKRVEATDTIQNMDMVKLEAEELDGVVVKEDGWKTEFSVLVDVIHDKKVKEEIQTLKLGDTIHFDVYQLEDKDAAHINKYILKKPEDSEQEIGNMFVGKIIEVSRIEPAEFDEEFFGIFGSEDVTDEASLREFIKNDIKRYYDQQADQFMSRDIMDRLMEINKIDLPVDFLKRYIKENNQNVTEEIVEQEFEDFAKNLRWSLKKSALAKTHDITVNDDDIRNHFTNSVFSYMRSYGNMDYSFITQTVDRLMKDKEQVNKAYEEVLADRIFSAIGNTVQKKKISISTEDFATKVKALNEKAKIPNE